MILLGGSEDLVSRSITPMNHRVSLAIAIVYLRTKSPDPPSRVVA